MKQKNDQRVQNASEAKNDAYATTKNGFPAVLTDVNYEGNCNSRNVHRKFELVLSKVDNMSYTNTLD